MKTLYRLQSLIILLGIILSPGKSISQSNQWTWMNGDNTINQVGIYDLQGSSSPITKPGARSESVSWTDKSGNFWLFGGVGYGSNNYWGPLNDLWKYNSSMNEWTWMKGSQQPWGNAVYGTKGVSSANNIPGSRQMSASWVDAVGNIWLFGGNGSGFFNDLWKYDVVANEWTWVNGDNTTNIRGIYGNKGIASPINKPGARNNPVCWADNAGNLWMFGGNGYAASGSGGYLGDLWKYNIGSNTWTWMKGDSVIQSQGSYGNRGIPSASNNPGSRMGASCWKDPLGNLWMFGGYGYVQTAGLLNDLWKYNVSTNEWEWVHGDNMTNHFAVYGNRGTTGPSNRPGATVNAVTWTDSTGSLWLFGGRGYTNTDFGEMNTLWKYNTSINQWAFIKGDYTTYFEGDYGNLQEPAETNRPGSGEQAVTWTDSLGNLWMFGGESYPANSTVTYFKNDLWKFSSMNLLPVSLLSFDGVLQDKNVLLNWIVENEIKFDHYEIEKSINGSVYELLRKVTVGSRSYDYTDYEAFSSASTVYYRLKMVDIDGKFSYSHIIKFNSRETGQFSLYPNPAKDFTQISFNKNIIGKISVEIIDMTGRLMQKNTCSVNGNYYTMPTYRLAAGNYAIALVYQGKRFVQNLVIVK
ncbi:MAG: kelch repeat-containing protein [Ferruginibacter sp.]